MSDTIRAQIEFCQWVKNWINPSVEKENPKETVIQPDILDIMAIFKVLGFDVLFTDVSDPKDMPKLKNSGNGIKIIATCSTSGMRSVMELETTCKCPETLDDSKLWVSNKSSDLVKYTANKKEIDDLITVPFATEFLIQSVINHFLHLIQNNDQNANNHHETPSKQLQLYTPNILNKSPKSNYFSNKQKTILNICAFEPTIKVTSPARYRSLDTLTGDLSLNEIPEPGELRKNESNEKNTQLLTSSSPNVAKIGYPSTSSPCQNCEPNFLGYRKLLEAQILINEVLGIMENKQNADKLNFDVSKIKGSIDSLLEKQEKPQNLMPKTVGISQVSTLKPKCRASIRTITSLKPNVTKSPNTRPVSKSTSSATVVKSLENISGGINQKTPTIKPNPKYMHIKSTISKTKTITKKSNLP